MRVLFASLLALGGLALGARANPVTLHYQERPPYYETHPDGVRGLVVDPLVKALQRAQLPYRLALTPSQRQLLLIEDSVGPHCGIGWFRNPVREAKGQFSSMLYQDQPLSLLARRALAWRDPLSMTEALQRTEARLLTKQGFSYGPQFDALLAQRLKPPETSTGEVSNLVRMLIANRADWMPLAHEEARWLLDAMDEASEKLQVLRFSDAPAGPTRHLYCNKAVPSDWMQRLNEALK
ncbi:hypothetical protein [Inhella gelatinilytica]|uniref:Solute-binding protein family 3/N-terminal domain-containing protein n=1 Tax=Inhella gelatinilytica TaxID=2795030 RepID=A0A931NBI7_9BURK|nr:hypothetical protein [Inhella gelatinilytica]MBH9553623.1 hypothetical protein [Inhella gelatinilytica]